MRLFLRLRSENMEDAGGLNSRGFAINSLGLDSVETRIVVGDTFTVVPMEPRSHAAMFKSGVVTDLGVLPGQVYSRANGINATGQVVDSPVYSAIAVRAVPSCGAAKPA